MEDPSARIFANAMRWSGTRPTPLAGGRGGWGSTLQPPILQSYTCAQQLHWPRSWPAQGRLKAAYALGFTKQVIEGRSPVDRIACCGGRPLTHSAGQSRPASGQMLPGHMPRVRDPDSVSSLHDACPHRSTTPGNGLLLVRSSADFAADGAGQRPSPRTTPPVPPTELLKVTTRCSKRKRRPVLHFRCLRFANQCHPSRAN